jgi:hypothetical protein
LPVQKTHQNRHEYVEDETHASQDLIV